MRPRNNMHLGRRNGDGWSNPILRGSKRRRRIGEVGGFYTKMATPTFWLLHAALAAGAGVCFVMFKFVAGRRLEMQPNG